MCTIWKYNSQNIHVPGSFIPYTGPDYYDFLQNNSLNNIKCQRTYNTVVSWEIYLNNIFYVDIYGRKYKPTYQ